MSSGGRNKSAAPILSNNMKLLKLYEVGLSSRDLDELGEDLTAVLATISHAVNEINLFRGLFLLSDPEFPSAERIRKKAQIQKFAITRALNAKTFEALDSIDQAKTVLNRRMQRERSRKVVETLRSVVEALCTIELQTVGLGYEVTKEIRDKVTNHYLPSEVRKNLPTAPYHSNAAMVLHETEGDSFYPFAEDLVFFPVLQKFATEKGKSKREIIDEWMSWSLASSIAVCDMHFRLSKILIIDLLGKRASQVALFAESELFQDYRSHPLPLFHFSVEEET